MFKLLDLFSGIGAMSLGLERSGGFETVAFCEQNTFCQHVLAKHWPEVPIYADVRALTTERLRSDGIAVNAIAGGWPCQDLSIAGRAAGLVGERSGLYREVIRLVRELRPEIVILENVAELLDRGFGQVLADLAACGYDAEWACISGDDIKAPQARDRVWIIAYPMQERTSGLVESLDIGAAGSWWPCRQADLLSVDPFRSNDMRPQPLIRRMDDGIAGRVDRVGACGNSLFPQISEVLGRAIITSQGANP